MMRTILGLSAAFTITLFAMSGCAGGVDEGVDNDEAMATAMSFYDCRGSFSEDVLAHMEVGLSKTKIEVTDLSKDAVPPDTGSLDSSFHPTPAFANFVRFQGFRKILDAFTFSDVAHMEIVVSPELQKKEATGKLFIRTSGSGGDSTSYFCKKKDAKLAVDTKTRSRLACSLDHLICQDDNPPGSTCLDDLFINQTRDDGATMRLTFMEHFGVNVRLRKDEIGMSDEMTRTTKKASFEWKAGHSLSLEYRGGITYTGTFKLPDGRSETAKCNDLAMLD